MSGILMLFRRPFSSGSRFSLRCCRTWDLYSHKSVLSAMQCSWTNWGENLIFRHDICTSTNLAAKNIRKNRKPVRVKKKSEKLEVVDIRPGMTVRELAQLTDRTIDQVYEAFEFIPGTDEIDNSKKRIYDVDILKEVVRICGFRHRIVSGIECDTVEKDKDEYPRSHTASSNLTRRPPVVTVMGHVDHGKTTLLDNLRNTRHVDQEHGGITQHIGAFKVKLPGICETITFLDTPGHAAFAAMRERGTSVTDIVILVVAAEDGVMEQTVECIQHATSAGVPIIVAINKIDKATPVQIETCKRELLEYGVLLEEFGGDVQVVEISALKNINLHKLCEAVVAQAEIANLKADKDMMVEASVLEAEVDPEKGKVATVIVQEGTLKKGAVLVAGQAMAKVRALYDDQGRPVVCAGPSEPVRVIGWKELPSAGEKILEVANEKRAREVVVFRVKRDKQKKALDDQATADTKAEEHRENRRQMLEERLALGIPKGRETQVVVEEVADKNDPALAVVLKGDVSGSVEALLNTLATYDNKYCQLDIADFGVGQVTESDVKLADNFKGIVYGFNVNVPVKVGELARECNVPVRTYTVIYRLINDLKNELTLRLPSIDVEELQGEGEVRQIISITHGKRKLDVAGSKCVKGTLLKSGTYKVYRQGELIHEGTVRTLRHLKNEVESVGTNVECGILLSEPDVKLEPGDTFICVKNVKVKRELQWDPKGFQH